MKPLRVLILQQRGWGLKFGHFIARRLQAQGCKLAAMTFKRSTHEFMTRQDEVDYEMIIGHDEIMDDPHHHLAGETFSLENIAEDLGLESVWPLIAALRNHVRSYGDKFFYSFRQNVSDEDIIAYVMAIHKCARRFLSEFQPDLIITSTFVSYAHAALGLYGERKGIPSIGTTDTKVRGISCFTNRYDETTGSFIERIDELNEGPDESPSLGRAREYIREARASLQRPAGDYASFGKPPAAASIADLIKNEIRPYYYILKWLTSAQRRSTNRHRALGITQDFRPPLCQLRDHYCFKKHKRFSDTYDYYPLDRISKAVYFPLQYQPESTIDMLAPFFTNQIEVARLAAMALPGDYTLMVKEHPSMVGLRPPSYLEKIARSPNVKIVDYRLSSETLLKKADAVITPCGTITAEAAFLHIPTIQLGRCGKTLRLPNVFPHTDMTTLTGKLSELLSMDLHTDNYERKLENYVAAAYDTGFDLDYFGFWFHGKDIDIEELWRFYEQEIERLTAGHSR